MRHMLSKRLDGVTGKRALESRGHGLDCLEWLERISARFIFL